MFHVGMALTQGWPLWRTRFAASMSLRMTATVTTSGGLPLALRVSPKALRPGSKRLATMAAN